MLIADKTMWRWLGEALLGLELGAENRREASEDA
jgi:hypothetical protein